MISPGDALETDFGESIERMKWPRVAGEAAALIYIAVIATIANVTGAYYVMFPELGALAHDVLTRPHGAWARSPIMLMITPALTGVVGIVCTRWLPYGYLSVLLTIGGAIVIVEGLRSPVAPAISAGLLPLVVGIKSWWYPPGVLMGTVLLAAMSIGLKFLYPLPAETADNDHQDQPGGPVISINHAGALTALIAFAVVAIFVVEITGLRFILFPPLMVIGYEMFAHPDSCPWVDRPLVLPIACFLTALSGFGFYFLLGVGPLAAACIMVAGVVVLRLSSLHMPPAFAVGLLPMVMNHPTIVYPFSVGIGTLLLTLWYLLYESRISAVRADPT